MKVVQPFKSKLNYSHGEQIKLSGYSIFTTRVYHGLPTGQIFTHHTLTLTNCTHTGYGYTLTCDDAVFFMKPSVYLIPEGYLAFSHTKGIKILYVLVNITKK